MAADRYGEMVSDLRGLLLTSLTPIEQISAIPKSIITKLNSEVSDADDLKRQNELLKTEILLLKAKQQQMINLKQEVSRLESLLGTTGKITDHKMQIAVVTQFSSNPISQYMTLNKGANDNVALQDTVIDADGVVGQVVATAPFSSRVMLLTDPDHHLPVRIQRTSQRAILSGTGYDNAKLNFIPKNSNVKIGDIIETSGLGNVFPVGFPAATITEIIDRPEEPYLEIYAQPIAMLHQAHKVLILKPEVIEPNEVQTNLDYALPKKEHKSLENLP